MGYRLARSLQQIVNSSEKGKENLCSVLEIILLLQKGAKPSILNKPRILNKTRGKDYIHSVTYKKRVYTASSLNPVETIKSVYHPKRDYLDTLLQENYL